MNPHKIKALIWIAFAFFLADVAFSAPDSCSLPFAGSYRATIKKRPEGLPYPKYNHGKPINLNQWFKLTEQFGKQLGTPCIMRTNPRTIDTAATTSTFL